MFILHCRLVIFLLLFCTARQCWPLDQLLWVLYNRSDFHRFWGNNKLLVPFFTFLSVIINRPVSYDSGILRQDYGIIRGFIDHYQSANILRQDYWIIRQDYWIIHQDYWIIRQDYWTIRQDYWIIRGLSIGEHLPEHTETSLFTASDQTVHSCNSWLLLSLLLVVAEAFYICKTLLAKQLNNSLFEGRSNVWFCSFRLLIWDLYVLL